MAKVWARQLAVRVYLLAYMIQFQQMLTSNNYKSLLLIKKTVVACANLYTKIYVDSCQLETESLYVNNEGAYFHGLI